MKGRPKEFKEREVILITLEKELREAFEEIRWREHKDIAELGREAISEYIKIHADGNNTYPLEKWQEDPSFQAIPAYLSDPEKWVQCYKNSNEKDRTKLRMQAMTLQKKFRMVDINQ